VRIKITLLFIVLLFTAVRLFAQPSDPNADPDIPITGIELLMALGGALGIRKLISDKRKGFLKNKVR